MAEGQWSALWSVVPKAEERGATIPILPRETGWPAGPGPVAKGKLETMSWVTGHRAGCATSALRLQTRLWPQTLNWAVLPTSFRTQATQLRGQGWGGSRVFS